MFIIGNRATQRSEEDEMLDKLCETVRQYVREEDWGACSKLIPLYMELFPDSAVPHNLWGIVKENMGCHTAAMKHFRAAWALDSTYTPANRNMDAFAVYDSKAKAEPAYTIADCMVKERALTR